MKPQPHYKKPYVIAEIGCNHMGDIEIAKEMILTASMFCKVDAIKLQKRNPRELLTEEQYNAPHPNPIHSYGDTYGAHREFLEFDLDEHSLLKDFCEEMGITYSTSVWDLTSAKEIASLNPEFIKIPSASNQQYEMLGWLCDNYSGKIHSSVGMTTIEEEEKLIDFFKSKHRAQDLVLYSCTSGYPVPFEDVCLLEVSRLVEKYGDDLSAIGFSGHHLGIAIDVAAYTLGAEYIERHYTLDRTSKGTDHSASLEPNGMRLIKRNLGATHKSLTYKEQEILEIEAVQRQKLKVQ